MSSARRRRLGCGAGLTLSRALVLALGSSVPTAAFAQTEGAPPSDLSAPAEPKAAEPTPAPPESAEPKSEPKPAEPESKAAEPKAEPRPVEPKPAPAPKPAPKPAPSRASVPVTSPPPGGAPPPPTLTAPPQQAPSAEARPSSPPSPPPAPESRAAQLERDLSAALASEPLDPRRLEEVCGAWQPRRVFEDIPLLGARLPLCLARAAMAQGRDEHAQRKLDEALAALRTLPVDAAALDVRAEALFRRAELREKALSTFERCGDRLGLRRLAAWEARVASQRLEDAVDAYQEVVRTGVRRWARRALFRTGRLYDDFYREVAASLPHTYLGVALPSPFLVEERDGAELLRPLIAPKAAAWPREIARVYDVLQGELERAGDDPALLAEVEARRDAFGGLADLPTEPARNVWLDALKPGVLRRTQRGFEERTEDGSWRVLDDATARTRLDAAIAGGVKDVEGAWALVALAAAGIPTDTAVLAEALESPDERIRTSALIALAESPRGELYETLVTRWQALEGDPEAPLLPSLQAALFGERERALVALRALANRERDLAGKLADDSRLSSRVRAYLLAELGDTRLLHLYQKLAAHPDRTTAAVALYGMYLAAGRRMIWSLRPQDPEPVGCVSRNLRGLFADEGGKLE